MLYEKLNKLCTEKGTTITALLKELGLSTSKGTAWKNGSIPKHAILKKIAAYFSVSVSDLFDDNNGLPNVENSPVSDISKEEMELLSLYNKLNTRGKLKAIEYMSDLSENERYSTEVDMEFHTRNA